MMSKKTVDYLSVQDLLEQFGAQIEKLREGDEPYEVTMSDDSEFYIYKQDSRKIILRRKSETPDKDTALM